jgi:adenine deaminase
MDVDAVLRGDDTLMAKIHLAQYAGRPIDGHAPLLSGEALARYVGAGISTDHESEGPDEAREKVRLGMKVLIREGSDAQNFEALHPLIGECPDSLMFCTDDLRPDDLLRRGHIDALVQRAIDYGHDLFDVLRIASLNPARHYGIPIGMLQTGDYADFIATDSLTQIAITDAVFRGRHIYEDGLPPTGIFSHAGPYALHKELLPGLQLKRIRPDIFALPVPEGARLRVMTSAHGTLLTGEEFHAPTLREGCAVADAERDLAKLVVINRYDPKQRPAVAFLRGTHLRAGAIAQSISHDNHHIIACGVSDEAIAEAVNAIIRDGGGISVAFAPGETRTLQLPIGGLISHKGIRYVTEELDAIGRHLTDLRAPGAEAFPPLSFLSLIVIPHLKLSHKGLYRSASAEFVPPYVTA